MIYKCYYDGGNKDDSKSYDLVSLAVMCGFPAQWDSFESDWRRMLSRHGTPWVHTTDLVTGNGPYREWSQRRCDFLGEDSVKVIRRHIARRKDNPKGRSEGIIPVVVTIDLKDFVAADKEVIKVSTSANQQLLRQALAISMTLGQGKNCTNFHMLFDQNESFYGLVHDLKNSKLARAAAPSLDDIIINSEVDMRFCPPLQMADMFAWTSGRVNTQKRRVWHSQLLNTDHGHQHLDKHNLGETIPGSQETWDSWKIPKRKATK